MKLYKLLLKKDKKNPPTTEFNTNLPFYLIVLFYLNHFAHLDTFNKPPEGFTCSSETIRNV